jgi:transposase
MLAATRRLQSVQGGRPRGIECQTWVVTGATALIRFAVRPGNKQATEWLVKLLAREPCKLVAVALANKIARTVWAMMTSGEVSRRQPVVAGAVSA